MSSITLFAEHGVAPDLITFGVLALCCHSKEDMTQLLSDLNQRGLRPNMAILATLVKNACVKMNPGLVEFALRKVERSGLRPNPTLLRNLERFHGEYRQHVLVLEREQQAKAAAETQTKTLVKETGGSASDHVPAIVRWERDVRNFAGWERFRQYCADWLSRADLDSEAEAHPWKQYVNERDLQRAEEKGDKEITDIMGRGKK